MSASSITVNQVKVKVIRDGVRYGSGGGIKYESGMIQMQVESDIGVEVKSDIKYGSGGGIQ